MCLCAICVCLVFNLKSASAKGQKTPQIEYSCYISNAKNNDEASLLLWNWLLKYTRLTPQHAASHGIYQKNTHAIFYDLDGDGTREILGTHNATTIAGNGNNLLYILKYDEKEFSKYRRISQKLYFDIHKPIQIYSDETGKYKRIGAKLLAPNELDAEVKNVTFVFDKRKNSYTTK